MALNHCSIFAALYFYLGIAIGDNGQEVINGNHTTMGFLATKILTLILFTPLVAGTVILLLPGKQKELDPLGCFCTEPDTVSFTMWLWFNFQQNVPGFQFEQRFIWYPPSTHLSMWV